MLGNLKCDFENWKLVMKELLGFLESHTVLSISINVSSSKIHNSDC